MPREVIREEDVKQAVAEKAAAAGGRIAHNDLVTAFEDEGRASWASVAIRLAQAKQIQSEVVSQPEGKAILQYWVE